jgi:hypothetical protein
MMSSSSRSASRPARTSCRSRIFELAGPVTFECNAKGGRWWPRSRRCGGRSAARPIERRRMFPLGRPRRGDVPRTPSSRRSVRAARYRSWGRPQFLDRGLVCGDRIPAHHPPSWPTLGQLFAAAVPRRAARAGRVRRTRGLAPRGCRAGTGSPLRRHPRTGPSRWHVASEYSTSTMEAATQAALQIVNTKRAAASGSRRGHP